MTVLSDVDINKELASGNLKIQGLTKDTIRENGIDLTISENYSVEVDEDELSYDYIIDMHNQPQDRFRKVKAIDGIIIIKPWDSIMVATQEVVELPANIVGQINIRSTFARSGIYINPTIDDAGFVGALTIRITNVSKRPLMIHVGDRFLHVVLHYTQTPCSKPYSGSYQGNTQVQQPKKSVL